MLVLCLFYSILNFILMRLNKYLFNRVNNKERERGQRSVVWLKRGQPCLHHLHVLSTVFSWWPFSSCSLWIILLPSDSRCFLLLRSNRFLSTLSSATPGFCAIVVSSLFVGDNVGGTFVPAFGHGFRLGVLSDTSWLEVRQQLGCGVFAE